MSASSAQLPTPVNPTGQLAQHIPSFDPAPAIAAQQQGLSDYLSLPTREILARLGLPQVPDAAPPPKPGEEHDPQSPESSASPMDPSQLISPVTDALGTLGSGLFDNVDPTTMFDGISKATDTAANAVRPAVGSLEQNWQGVSGSAAGDKANAALANGAEVSRQAAGLRGSLAKAAATVAQAKARHIEIISEFQATIAAIGPNIIFPWGWAAAIAAANRAVAQSVEVITETQAILGGEAATVSAVGAPVPVTAAPALGASMIGPLVQMATGLISPMTSLATQSGSQAAEKKAKDDETTNRQADLAGAESPAAGGPMPVGGGAGAGGSGGGGAGATPASRLSAPASPASAAVTAESAPVSASRPAMSGMGMGGGGMMGAPMAGAGAAGAGAGNGHTAASFLHTSDQRGDIIGELGSVAPPVIGEADPNDTPDIELRI